MESFKTFIANNWHFLVSGVLLLVVSTLMGWVFKPSVGCCLVMLFNFIVFGLIALCSDYKCSIIIFASSFLLMWLFCWLGWNYLTLLLPIAILAISAIITTKAPGLMALLLWFFNSLLLVGIQESKELNDAKHPRYAVEAVITEITKRDHDDIMVVLETKEGITILPFMSSVEDAWRLEKGDTISFNVYNDMIVAFEKK